MDAQTQAAQMDVRTAPLARRAALAALLALAPLPALAQDVAPGTDAATGDRRAVRFDEIERGFYVGLSAGPFFLLEAPGADGTPRPFSAGQMAQLELGFDLGERLSLGLFGMGAQSRAGSEFEGYSGGAASGDLTTLVGGGALKLRAVGFQDDQGVKRTWLTLRGGAGYATFRPTSLMKNPATNVDQTSDILVFAGPGVEYYTRLRHFSVGLDVTGTYLLSTGSAGFAVSPNLRYAF